ncbi:hypothetical protein E2562_002047 [Oryza meyeriana var. granulata]|uniref:Uncharacterized protein n=1 Tax=Oryza meyeriana var. granulata TaxID=110450 RepID=A0A6G1ECF6_9ORYZ|nr:hypothetical protein E2562_002047 [Oryza meyeriana var. granulata]
MAPRKQKSPEPGAMSDHGSSPSRPPPPPRLLRCPNCLGHRAAFAAPCLHLTIHATGKAVPPPLFCVL